MIKNGIIACFAMNMLFKITPYSFTVKESVVTTVAGVALMTYMMCSIDKTIMEHVSYRKRSKFRRLIGMTTLRG